MGDGNFHIVFALDATNEAEITEVSRINSSLVAHALSAGGTCTGEHGVGIDKTGYLEREFDAGALALMRALKGAVDPNGLMNPGKILR